MIDYTLPLEELPDPLPIEPLRRPFDVTITPPGSKSITNRAYVLAALAQGESRIIRPLRADDTDLLLKALCTLGAEAKWVPGQTGAPGDSSEDVLIKGVGGRFPRGGYVNLGDGGTPTRFMIACACLAAEPVVLDGSKRMRERPVAEGVDMLRQLGATIEYVEQEGRLPLRVMPSEKFRGGEIEVGRTQSSQPISALLLIGSCLTNGIRMAFWNTPTSYSYMGLTCEMLDDWEIKNSGATNLRGSDFEGHVEVPPAGILSRSHRVQPDASSAAYWCLAAATNAQSTARIGGFSRDTHQPDEILIHYLDLMGARSTITQDLRQRTVSITGTNTWTGRWLTCTESPDGAVGLSAALALADGTSRIDGLRTLRVKETDRIAALASELRKVGCEVETTEDSITIRPIGVGQVSDLSRSWRLSEPPAPPARRAGETSHGSESRATEEPIIIETYNDHRMAMAFAVLGLRVPGIQIRNPACVKKSYPEFWKDFQKLYDNPRQ